MHKGCVLQRVSLGALSDATVVLWMRQSIDNVVLRRAQTKIILWNSWIYYNHYLCFHNPKMVNISVSGNNIPLCNWWNRNQWIPWRQHKSVTLWLRNNNIMIVTRIRLIISRSSHSRGVLRRTAYSVTGCTVRTGTVWNDWELFNQIIALVSCLDVLHHLRLLLPSALHWLTAWVSECSSRRTELVLGCDY